MCNKRRVLKYFRRKYSILIGTFCIAVNCLFFYVTSDKFCRTRFDEKVNEEHERVYNNVTLWNNVPDWVIKLNMTSLFDWTWHHNQEYGRYMQLLQTNHSVIPSKRVPFVVNDVKTYLRTHPDEGFIVDDFRQLDNPVLHPLPHSKDLNATCNALNLIDINPWESCMHKPRLLSQRVPGTTHSVTVAILNALIDDGTCDEMVPGTVYTSKSTYHFQQWSTRKCYNSPIYVDYTNKQIQYHEELLDSIGVYLSSNGHFAPQQLPRVIRLLAVAPKTAKLLVAKGGTADQFVDVLIEKGLVTRDRIVPYEKGRVYAAKIVYRTESWPYLTGDLYGKYAHDRTDMESVRKVFVSTELSDEERNFVIIVKRAPDEPRAIKNHNDLVKLVEENIHKSRHNFQIYIFTAKGHVRDHIRLWQKARIVIAPHGAGLFNVMWCKPGTAVIEIGYDKGWPLPEMYFEMASHCGHHYWLVKGEGKHSTPITVDLLDLDWSIQQALDAV